MLGSSFAPHLRPRNRSRHKKITKKETYEFTRPLRNLIKPQFPDRRRRQRQVEDDEDEGEDDKEGGN